MEKYGVNTIQIVIIWREDAHVKTAGLKQSSKF